MGSTAKSLRDQRSRIIRDLMRHSLATVAANAGGWAADRFDQINACDWDLCEIDPNHRPFKWGQYQARLLKSGKGMSYRPSGG